MSKLTPSLQDILYRLVDKGLRDGSDSSLGGPGRFPVVVKPETRRFLESQANALGSSMAGVAGAILDGVALATMHGDTAQYSMQGIAERVSLMLREHGLSMPAAAEALADIGLTLEVLSDRQRLMASLTSERLGELARLFRVDYDWLCGKEPTPGHRGDFDWYKSPLAAARNLLAAIDEYEDVELCLVCTKSTDLSRLDDEGPESKLPHITPCVVRRRKLPGGETIAVYDVASEGRWSYWPCRRDLKILIHFSNQLSRIRPGIFHLAGRYVTPDAYSRLRDGSILAASVLGDSRRSDWYPDEYIAPRSSDGRPRNEWENLREDPEMAAVLNAVEALLS